MTYRHTLQLIRMNKKITIVFIVLGIVGILGYVTLDFLCRVGVKCKNCTRTSISKEESINSGYYLMDYEPLKPNIKLKYHDEQIIFNEVWVESQWFYNSDNCLFTKKEKRDGFNVIFEFDKSNESTFLFSLSPVIDGQIDITNGGIMETKKEIRLSQISDTLWLRIHEKNPKEVVGWKEKLDGELIGFIKK